ncbi:MAG: glutathione S-transferase family protein [Acidobacteria bacterium]|nr:glutathione S-transferase family protein [Acidobacteriota bacterium]
MRLTLYHIHASPFAEKARWALDFKGLEYKSELLIPGRHADTVEKISGTRTVPVLVDTDAPAPIADSTDILQHLERIAPDHALFPEGDDERQQVLEIEDWLDEQVVRPCARMNYSFLSEQPEAFFTYFSRGLSRTQKLGMAFIRPMLPRIVKQFREQRELSREAAKGYHREVDSAFERIERMLANSGGRYLVGDSFTAADLTAACMLGLALRLAGTPWEVTDAERRAYPGRVEPDELLDFRAELAGRSTTEWVAGLWRNHR